MFYLCVKAYLYLRKLYSYILYRKSCLTDLFINCFGGSVTIFINSFNNSISLDYYI